MLLTLRTLDGTGFARPPAHESAVRTVDVPGGRAHLFCPRADTAAVMLDLDPLPPAPGSAVPGQAAAAAGSLLGLALGRFFDAWGDDGDPPREVQARLPALWSPAGAPMLTRLFAPLGYAVEAARLPLNPEQPRAGMSPFFAVALTGRQRPRDLVSHLRVLLPLFDERQRGMSDGDADALWAEGRAWLEAHPAREVLEMRLLRRAPRSAVHDLRHDAVLAALRESGARRVLDLGCGPGALLGRIAEDPRYTEVVGVEVARDELAEAAARVADGGRTRVLHGSLAYRDARLAGFDAAALVEVIEHLDPPQLAALEDAVWDAARPATVIVTTPNADYNALFPDRGARMRHPDHRFEWTRAEFAAWAHGVAARHGYAVRFGAAGPEDAAAGALSQMAVFTRLGATPYRECESAKVRECESELPAGSHSRTDALTHSRTSPLRLEDVAGERTIATRHGDVHVGADEAAAALEGMSRFAVDPRWLLCLPPAMPAAACEAGSEALEHPRAALDYYRARGVAAVDVQPLHRGTHVVAVVCRDAEAARRRGGASGGRGARRARSTRPPAAHFSPRVRRRRRSWPVSARRWTRTARGTGWGRRGSRWRG